MEDDKSFIEDHARAIGVAAALGLLAIAGGVAMRRLQGLEKSMVEQAGDAPYSGD